MQKENEHPVGGFFRYTVSIWGLKTTLIQEIYFAKAAKVCNEFWYIHLRKRLDVVDESIGTFGVIRFDSTSWANILTWHPGCSLQNQHILIEQTTWKPFRKIHRCLFSLIHIFTNKTSLNLGNLTSERVYIPKKRPVGGLNFGSGLCVGWTIFCRDLPPIWSRATAQGGFSGGKWRKVWWNQWSTCCNINDIGSTGPVYLPWIVDFYGKWWEIESYMDPMGIYILLKISMYHHYVYDYMINIVIHDSYFFSFWMVAILQTSDRAITTSTNCWWFV